MQKKKQYKTRSNMKRTRRQNRRNHPNDKLAAKLIYLVLAALLTIGTASTLRETENGGYTAQNVSGNEQSGRSGQTGKTAGAQETEIHYIDVGQGDSALIRSGGHTMLIDCGQNDKGTALQLYLKKQGVERLDYLVLTHPDADHIGGADVIITKFEIDTVFMSDFKKDNKTYREVIDALEAKRLPWSVPQPGEVYPLGEAQFTILAPNREYSDPNNASIALLFQNGDNTFLFTGDAEEEAENDILANGLPVKADVYKAGHHGSDTASSEAFLEAVSPEYAVISCGEGNSYGHPHAEVLNRLRAMGVRVFRTDEQGSIIAWSDGNEITWNCAPSETWQSGERTGSAGK